ncbi:hypothetical protein [Bosea sp. 124]|uniref:hypothetical protein n=1 Tax=Bosea sp. 124 TaxID=2135642 RepID=UPI0011B280BE|nr:hypothetical protein [Bosea sp. 124]
MLAAVIAMLHRNMEISPTAGLKRLFPAWLRRICHSRECILMPGSRCGSQSAETMPISGVFLPNAVPRQLSPFTGIRIVITGDRQPEPRSTPHGPGRRMLKMLVEIDSSRFLRNRVGAAMALAGLLAIFAGIGYGVPAVISQYF